MSPPAAVSVATSALRPPLLEVEGLSKRFGSFVALDGVSLRVTPGTVHALLGENGAGKSTLVKCIMGYHQPDGGRITVGAHEGAPRSPREAQALGIGMVYQHFTLVPNMSVCENMVLARATLPMLVDWPAERAALASFFGRMPFKIDLDAPVRSLSAGEKQKVEILKQLYLESLIVILDEPTSVLTPAEADEVLSMLHAMTRSGAISIVIITHKFREVTQFADEVTVLRRGRGVGRGRVGELTTTAMAEMMMGGALPPESKGKAGGAVGDTRLRVEGLRADDDAGVSALRGLTFEVRAGEIVGIAAVAGNGQEELVEVLAGQRPRTEGTVRVSGATFAATRAQMRAGRVRCLPEEPLRNACVAAMSVAENMAFREFDEPRYVVLRWLVSEKAIEQSATKRVADYGIRTPSIHTPIGKLSGGNVQRAVLARELEGEVDVLIAANPCMGLDFAAVAEIHARIRAARDRGAAVLLVSADLDEIFALASRILVMSEGAIAYETPVDGAEPAVLGKYMAGHGSHDDARGATRVGVPASGRNV
jgi:simple sugar transport system ATP-binding protein